MSDFEPITFSEQEEADLRRLLCLARQTGFEHGIMYSENGVKELCDNLPDRVLVKFENDVSHVRMFHCHTNEMPLSIQDMSLLCNQRVDSVTVITSRGEVYQVDVGTGERVSRDEYLARAGFAAESADINIMDRDDFFDLDIAMRNYEACKETMVLISREFKWILRGGNIDVF